MSRKKKNIDPNYKIMFASYVSALQNAYQEAVEAKKKELDCWHFNQYGELVRVNVFPLGKAKEAETNFKDTLKHFESFKRENKDKLIECGCIKESGKSKYVV